LEAARRAIAHPLRGRSRARWPNPLRARRGRWPARVSVRCSPPAAGIGPGHSGPEHQSHRPRPSRRSAWRSAAADPDRRAAGHRLQELFRPGQAAARTATVLLPHRRPPKSEAGRGPPGSDRGHPDGSPAAAPTQTSARVARPPGRRFLQHRAAMLEGRSWLGTGKRWRAPAWDWTHQRNLI